MTAVTKWRIVDFKISDLDDNYVIQNTKYFYRVYIARSLSCYGFQKVGYTAENCKWYNLNPDLWVTPRILFLLFIILFS